MALEEQQDLISITADINAAHVGNNIVAVGDIATLVKQVHDALSKLGQPAGTPAAGPKAPAVSVRASIKHDYLVCLSCGKKQKALKRHLSAAHGLTPAEYRSEWDLNKDYPIVAADYSERRSTMAKDLGLGRKKAAPVPGKRGRPQKAAV